MALYHHGAIMQGSGGVKDTNQQVIAELGVEPDTAVGHILESYTSLNDNQRAGLQRSKRGRRQHYLVIHSLAKLAMMTARKRQPKTIAKINQRLANLGLEQDDNGNADVEQSTAQYEFKGGKFFFE